MFSSSSLTDEQKEAIHGWAAEGAQIADIQRKLGSEFGVTITYMEARFMILDLEVQLLSEDVAEEEEEEEEVVEKVATGEVHVTVDTIVRPGAAISGSVEFSDGEKAIWAIDQMGSLDLDADTAGYRPTELDIQKFQDKLREHLKSMQ